MKSILLILLISLLQVKYTYGQLNTIFEHEEKTSKGEFTFCLGLSKDKNYTLWIENYSTQDFGPEEKISLGTYTLKNEILILKDRCNGYTMTFYYKKDSLIVQKAFSNMNGLIFNNKNIKDWESSINPNSSYKTTPKKRKIYKKLKNGNNQFTSGNYLDNKYQPINQINLLPDSTFIYSIFEIVFLKGTWTKSGNEIILIDPNMNTPFYLLIDKENLINLICPSHLPDCFYLKTN